MKTKLKLITLALAASIVIGGCSSGSGQKTDSEEKDFLSKLTGSTDKETTLTFYVNARRNSNFNEVLAEVQKRAHDKINAKLEFNFVWNYFEPFIQHALLDGAECDAIVAAPENLQTIVDKGFAKDITSSFPKFAPNYYGSLNKSQLNAARIDGKMYAVPSRPYPGTTRYCALVRKDLAEKYGIRQIDNYKTLEDFLDKVRNDEKDIVPMLIFGNLINIFPESYGYCVINTDLRLVYKWNDPSMKLIPWEQAPEFKEAADMVARWKKKGFFMPGMTVFAPPPNESLLSSGKFACILAGMGFDRELNYLCSNNGLGFTYESFPLYLDKKSERTDGWPGIVAVNSQSPDVERVLMFIEWLQSNQENYDLLMYGISGKQYITDGTNFSLPEGVDARDAFFNWGGRLGFVNSKYEKRYSDTPAEYWPHYLAFIEKYSEVPLHDGFNINMDDLGELATDRSFNPSKIENDLDSQYDDKSVDNYIKVQRESGVDNLAAQVQKQLDEWRTGGKGK